MTVARMPQKSANALRDLDKGDVLCETLKLLMLMVYVKSRMRGPIFK
jgi:hypothetical protein